MFGLKQKHGESPVGALGARLQGTFGGEIVSCEKVGRGAEAPGRYSFRHLLLGVELRLAQSPNKRFKGTRPLRGRAP